MKSLSKSILFLFLGVILFTSCDKNSPGRKMTIGGNTDFGENKVGFKASGLSTLGNTNLPQTALEVVGNNKGTITLQFTAPLNNDLRQKIDKFGNSYLQGEFDKYKSDFIDANGNLSAKGDFINSDEGVAFIDPKGNQAVIMKYDSNVGDKWTYTNIHGNKFDFEVNHKSTTEDYSYGFFQIKVVKVEVKQKSFNPGYSKIVYIGNHKFGLVGMEVYLEDGTVVKSSRI